MIILLYIIYDKELEKDLLRIKKEVFMNKMKIKNFGYQFHITNGINFVQIYQKNKALKKFIILY